MAVSTATAPELTREQVQAMLVRPLEAASTFLASGPRIFDSASPVRIPKLGGAITDPGFTGENVAIPERDVDFGEVTLLPSTMEMRQGDHPVLKRDGPAVRRYRSTPRSVTGSCATWPTSSTRSSGPRPGTASRPRWVCSPTPVCRASTRPAQRSLSTTCSTRGDSPSPPTSTCPGSAGSCARRRFTELRKVKDASDRYQLIADPTQDGVFRLFGAPVTVTGRLPLDAESQSTVVLADFSQIAVARDVAPSVTVLSERYADYDQQAIRVVARYDAAPLNPEAVVKIVNVA